MTGGAGYSCRILHPRCSEGGARIQQFEHWYEISGFNIAKIGRQRCHKRCHKRSVKQQRDTVRHNVVAVKD